MKIIVKDANIIFSLLDSELMDACLKLDYEVWTSDFVINEIENTGQKRKSASTSGVKKSMYIHIVERKLPKYMNSLRTGLFLMLIVQYSY
ncbi:MAG: hypothetical protein Q8933_07610 [Bacteroidota bacterium]|nr:hypothetical protein [Bacteroidota bacterium]